MGQCLKENQKQKERKSRFTSNGRRKQKCLEEYCPSGEHQGETDTLHPKTVSDEEGLPVIVALKPGVRKAAHPPSEFSCWQSLFLCSSDQESLCRVSNHSTKRIQHIPMHGNPPDNINKTFVFLSQTINSNITPRDRCISRPRRLSYTMTDRLPRWSY